MRPILGIAIGDVLSTKSERVTATWVSCPEENCCRPAGSVREGGEVIEAVSSISCQVKHGTRTQAKMQQEVVSTSAPT